MGSRRIAVHVNAIDTCLPGSSEVSVERRRAHRPVVDLEATWYGFASDAGADRERAAESSGSGSVTSAASGVTLPPARR
jgi:hypothetical protein